MIKPIQKNIAKAVKKARLQRKITQQELAYELHLSQSRYSEIESGKGSFTAEQLILIIKKFNLSLSLLLGDQSKQTKEDELQKALNRLGAKELLVDPNVLPSERLEEVTRTIIETIVSADSARQLVSLAPVIIKNVDHINYLELRSEVQRLGFFNRLGWIIKSTAEATKIVSLKPLQRESELLLRRVIVKLRGQAVFFMFPESDLPEDLLDKNIISEKTRDQVIEKRSELAKEWKIITAITTEDFVKAIEGSL